MSIMQQQSVRLLTSSTECQQQDNANDLNTLLSFTGCTVEDFYLKLLLPTADQPSTHYAHFVVSCYCIK